MHSCEMDHKVHLNREYAQFAICSNEVVVDLGSDFIIAKESLVL